MTPNRAANTTARNFTQARRSAKLRAASAFAAIAIFASAVSFAAVISVKPVTAPAGKKAAVKSSLPKKYAQIIKRNMFGFLPRKEGNAAPASGAPPVTFDTPPSNPLNAASAAPGVDIPVNAVPEPAYSLTGIIEVNGEYKAIIEDRASGRGYYISEGSSIGEFKAAKITSSGVTLEKPDKKIDINLDSSKTAEPQTPAPPKSELVPIDKNERRWLPPSVAPRLGGK